MIYLIKKQKTRISPTSSSSRGFTLIETFVAITILMITVLGPMTLLSKALQESRYIKDEITATFLAQEGTEIIIYGRNSFLNLSDLAKDYSCNLMFNKDSGYNCKEGSLTIFEREIVIDDNYYNNPDPDGSDQYLIISTVKRNGFLNKDIVSTSIIFVN
jgi:type II secretory pathway pseudopilin PulG